MRRIAAIVSITVMAGCAGSGDGVFAPFNLYTAVAVDDLDKDTANDVVATRVLIDSAPPHAGTAMVLLQDNLSAGAFLPAATYSVGADPWAVAVGDINNDSLVDLVVANTEGDSVTVRLQNPANPGSFLSAAELVTGSYPESVAIGDLNADGLDDLVVSSSPMTLLFNKPGAPGTFNAVTLSLSGSSVAVSDLDGDNYNDMVIADPANGRVRVVRQSSITAGTFHDPVDYAAGLQPIRVAVGNLNGDDHPDIAVANYGSPSDPASSSVSTLMQDAANPGQFLAPTTYATDHRSTFVAIGDLNNNSRLDLAVANAGSLGSSDCDLFDTCRYTVVHGGISVLLQHAATAGVFMPAVNYSGKGSLGVAIADLNKDGFNDLAIAEEGIKVRFQNSASPGSFLAAELISK